MTKQESDFNITRISMDASAHEIVLSYPEPGTTIDCRITAAPIELDRFDRLVAAARMRVHLLATRGLTKDEAMTAAGLEPGDLDPLV